MGDFTRVTVKSNDFVRGWHLIEGAVLKAVARVGSSGWYILGEEVRRFEAALAAAWPVPHAVGVGSGLDGLEIALRCLGLRRGDRVLTTPLSAFATTLAIVRVGGTPVFVDVDDSGLLDLDRCREALRHDRTIRWLLPVHLYGHALDLEALADLQAEFGLGVVEDCAQSIGARSRGRTTGTVARAAATSFYPTKNLGALGDAGAVLTAEATVAEEARALRHYGQTSTYVHDRLGLNSRLDELHAAILHDALLPHLQDWTARRSAIAAAYRDGISHPRLTVPPIPAGSESVWHLFPVLAAPPERSAFIAHLNAGGVQTGVHYPRLIPCQRALAEHGGFEVIGETANAERFARGEVSLPIHPFLADAEVAQVVACCNAWRPA